MASIWILLSLVLGLSEPADPAPAGVAVRAGKVITLDDQDRVFNQAVVLIRNGLFEAVGPEKEIEIPAGYRIIDARDRWVCPGLVDFHSHIGGSLSDLNDGIYLTNPKLRVDEAFLPDNERIRDARAAGITSLVLLPGSGTNMAGTGILYKSTGRTVEESVIPHPRIIKMAQAGNPERYWYGVGRTMMNWNTRTTLEGMRDYHLAREAWEQGKAEEEPPFDPELEALRDLFRHRYPACMHTQAYQVCLNTFTMMHDYFGFWTVPTHSTFDAYKLASLARDRDIVIIAGPRNIFMDYNERRINGVPARWWAGGVRDLGTETDAPVLPIEEHSYQAALACRMGWEPYPALKGLCRATAKGAMIDHRVGSIEIGKDGDLGIWTGDPLDPRSACCLTVIEGRVVYDWKKDRRY